MEEVQRRVEGGRKDGRVMEGERKWRKCSGGWRVEGRWREDGGRAVERKWRMEEVVEGKMEGGWRKVKNYIPILGCIIPIPGCCIIIPG
jgi:hypothetical protein